MINITVVAKISFHSLSKSFPGIKRRFPGFKLPFHSLSERFPGFKILSKRFSGLKYKYKVSDSANMGVLMTSNHADGAHEKEEEKRRKRRRRRRRRRGKRVGSSQQQDPWFTDAAILFDEAKTVAQEGRERALVPHQVARLGEEADYEHPRVGVPHQAAGVEDNDQPVVNHIFITTYANTS